MLFNFVLFLTLLFNALVVSAAPIKDAPSVSARSADISIERVFENVRLLTVCASK